MLKLLLKLLTPSKFYPTTLKVNDPFICWWLNFCDNIHLVFVQKILLKEISELSNYIDKSQLPSSLGGYLIYCHQSWVSFVKVNPLTFGQCWCEVLLHWLDHDWSTLFSFWNSACFFTSICLSVKHSAKRQRLSALWSLCKLNTKAHCAALLYSSNSFAIMYKWTLGPSYVWRDTLLLLWCKIRQPNGFLHPDRSFVAKFWASLGQEMFSFE